LLLLLLLLVPLLLLLLLLLGQRPLLWASTLAGSPQAAST
jgi:hypothetical protein